MSPRYYRWQDLCKRLLLRRWLHTLGFMPVLPVYAEY
jgi:hypothetical protein